MEHLDLERLSRLVDEPPSPAEQNHLSGCERCRDELEALRRQTSSLRHLPALRPPSRGWEELEERLHAEGLITEGGFQHSGSRAGPVRGWVQVAAGLVLLLGGMGVGMGLGSTLPESLTSSFVFSDGEDPETDMVWTELERLVAVDSDAEASDLSLDEASELVRVTGEWHRAALLHYRERALGESADTDPISRYAALEALTTAGQVAVREAPTDPFLNNLLLNMEVEREATLRGLQARMAASNWY